MLTQEQLDNIIAEFGGHITVTNQQQLATLLEPFEIFLEKNAVYQDLWAQHSQQDKAHHIKHKALRLEMLMAGVPTGESPSPEQVAAMEDSALDLINYAVFLLRLMRGLRP